jgi:hypothetical protein
MDAMLRSHNDIRNDRRFLMCCMHSIMMQDVRKYVSSQKTKFMTYVFLLSEIGAKRDVSVGSSLRHYRGYQYVLREKSLMRTEMFRPE